MATKQSKYMVVETGGKLYLYAADLKEQERVDEVSLYSHPQTAKPMTKAEAVRLAAHLLNWATR